MLTITNLTYRIGGRTIFDDASVMLQDGWHVGVVGLNGTGKSTLFKLISGELHADGGDIKMNQKKTFGMVRQDMPDVDTPVIDMVLQSNEELHRLTQAAETETDPYKIGEIYERLGEIDAYTAPSRAAILLTGLGFRDDQMQTPFNSLSGGWRMRVALAAALFQQPDILLLDEPTNHLDLEAILWLEGYLPTYPHTLLVISHDRSLLNLCADHILHVENQKLNLYTGNYDTFERERAERRGLQQKMHEKQMAARAHMQAFIDRFKAKASKARQAQSRMKALERMDIVDAVIADRAIRFSFPQPEEMASPLIAIDRVDIGYAPGKPVLRGVGMNIDMDDRIALIGANGNGKSTLIKLIANKLAPLQGDMVRSGKLRIGYFSQHQTEELDINSTPYHEMYRLMAVKKPDIKEPVVRAVLGQFNFSKGLADNKISSLSGGEKARLLFALMTYEAPHVLLLDEPTNHLDIDAREALVMALNEYKGAVIIVSHDPMMLERVADRLLLIHEGRCTTFDGDMDDYRKFVVEQRKQQRKASAAAAEAQRSADAAVAASPVIDTIATPSPASSSKQKKALEKAEKLLAQLQSEKDRLEKIMLEPDYFKNPAHVAATQKEYEATLGKIAEQEEIWLSATG